ncbi:MAG TPA: Ig domain-containing protein [Candidatus Binatia bacterium]|nr:Ig domain-containing protein [Candidatus Binatia bacterium]
MGTRLAVALPCLAMASCLVAAQNLRIAAPSSQGAIVGEYYGVLLSASGGASPYVWQLVGGNLPPGLRLHSDSGKISGRPTTPGEYHFAVSATDSSVPHLQARRDLTIDVIAGLSVAWKEPPTVQGRTISGSAIVSNRTAVELELTVTVLAVNEIGRATTLGYQHFRLGGQSTSQLIAFGSGPGPGTYYVHVDAVAHEPGHHHLYRASRQTPAQLKVAQY